MDDPVAIAAAMMVLLATVAETAEDPLVTGWIIFLIGAVPLHDLLVHGHEATHGNASRQPRVNGFVLWFTHALVPPPHDAALSPRRAAP